MVMAGCPLLHSRALSVREGVRVGKRAMITFTVKRSVLISPRNPEEEEDHAGPQIAALKERAWGFFERLAKGVLAVVLYGSGTLVFSGVLFYFSWKLGLTALFVLSGLLPLSASVYLLWRLTHRERRPWLWRSRAREAAILKLARRLGGRLTVADVALGTGLSLQAAEVALNELVRRGYAELQVSRSGVLVYHCFPLADGQDKSHAERVLS
jgi:hypothetical protein